MGYLKIPHLTCDIALIFVPTLFLSTTANAVGMQDRVDSRQERRGDAVDNTAQGIEDRQDFRVERRDCIGEGANCRQDNRHEKANDIVDRANNRQDDNKTEGKTILKIREMEKYNYPKLSLKLA